MSGGRSVLLTGCSSGIGHHAAHGLARRGYRVIASARDGDAVARLRAEGLDAVRLDLDSGESIRDGLAEALALAGGRLDALVNNAGYGQYGALESLSREALQAQFQTNLFGLHELTAQVLAVMRRQQRGRIVQISSLLGLVALPCRGAYSASKFALEAYSDALRLELRGSGVTVSLIEPGPIVSRFGPNAEAAFLRHVDLHRGPHQRLHATLLSRLRGDTDSAAGRHRLGPEAVLRKIVHALESPKPRPRYPVTRPAVTLSLVRRLLPTRLLDRLLANSL